MKRSAILTPSVALLALAVVSSASAYAQQRERGRDRGDRSSEGRAVERGERRSESPRGDEPRQRAEAPTPAPRVEQPRAEQPRQEQRQPERRAESRRDGYDGRRDGYDGRRDAGPRRDNDRRETAVPRVYAPRYEPRYAPRYTPRYDPRWDGRYIVPRYYEPRWYQPRFYYRPFVFRPRFSIGFGILAGYPVPYTYTYPYSYGASYYGGVRLDIAPFNGAVYVDGVYAGMVEDFDGTNEVLTLRAGRHRIEVEAPGYTPLVFDVDVLPGQVIPYRGDLQPY